MSTPYQTYWNQVKEYLKGQQSTKGFSAFENKISCQGMDDGTFRLVVNSPFVRDRLVEKYIPFIESRLTQLTGSPAKVTVTVDTSLTPQAIQESTSRSVGQQQELEKEQEKRQELHRRESGVNPDYTFDSFVMGGNSAYAYNAAFAIAKDPGRSYNPCLIYGGVGLGKTHLLNAIGNYVLAHDPDATVLYISAESFMNEFINSIKSGDTKAFKTKFRSVDVLLMDDIQFIQNTTSTQDELFHTFNELYETKKQMVFTCDRPLNELKGIADRLTSRFERGLNADLQPPAFETRVAILQNKCQTSGKYISEDIIRYIAENVQSNVRDLEASLTKLISYSDLLHITLTLDKAKELLDALPFMQKKSMDSGVNISTIIKTVCAYYNVSVSDIKGKKRNKSLTTPRMIAMYLAKKMTTLSFTEIGAEFGGKDHTTVMNANSRISSLASVDPEYKTVLDKLEKEISRQ